MTNLVYRGPIERARLAFLIEASAAALGPVHVAWLAPTRLDGDKLEHVSAFFRGCEGLTSYEVMDGTYPAVVAARRRLRPILASTDPLVVVGDDALDFVRGCRSDRLVWCLNGIPEERSLVPSRRDRVVARIEWSLRRIDPTPDLVVTVSDPMAEHVKANIGDVATFAAPCCVDRGTFAIERPVAERGPVVAYMGSGAPWQHLAHTAEVWRVAARRRPDLRFAVISRDERCDRLLDGLEGRGERVAVSEPSEVAQALQGARVGMLLREDHLVNRVAFPTKLGEYLGCGVSVLASDLAWDVSTYLSTPGAGAVVGPARPVPESVDALLALVDVDPAVRTNATSEAADRLARSRWVALLAEELAQVRPSIT